MRSATARGRQPLPPDGGAAARAPGPQSLPDSPLRWRARAHGGVTPRAGSGAAARALLSSVLPSTSALEIVAIEGEREAAEFGPDARTAGWYVRNQGRPLLLRVIHPNSDFRRTWDACTSVVALALVWQVPLHLVFEWWLPPLETVNAVSTALFVPALLLRWLATCWLCADIVLSFRTGFITSAGVLVMDERRIAARYAARWLLVDVLGMLPFESLFPEDHALSYLGPYRCRRGSRRQLGSEDNALFYCERQLGLAGKLRNVRRVLGRLPPVPRMVALAKEQGQLLPTLRALPRVIRRAARTVSTFKRLKWFKLGRVLQALRLCRAIWAQLKFAYFSAQKQMRAQQLRLRHLREMRREAAARRRAASVPAQRAAGRARLGAGAAAWLSPERVRALRHGSATRMRHLHAYAHGLQISLQATLGDASAAAARRAGAAAARAHRLVRRRRRSGEAGADADGADGARGAEGPPLAGGARWAPLRLWRRRAPAAPADGGARGRAAHGGGWARRGGVAADGVARSHAPLYAPRGSTDGTAPPSRAEPADAAGTDDDEGGCSPAPSSVSDTARPAIEGGVDAASAPRAAGAAAPAAAPPARTRDAHGELIGVPHSAAHPSPPPPSPLRERLENRRKGNPERAKS
ncbi:hypothetical protein KFE25_014226 [Diacronema lutheri]|uniref:Ion transport domain-containing protein n=1 Tax=Diacronema lutheri TaxID=2081491 RepID=A0A8J5X7F3_DIALT|nr:hypothetical protein KFE25_014226 [Diacronema lutheri]